jgi:NAD(P)-dependent dehydrogenase (short-subunit alcohol dehydrogenase family)
VPQRAALVTGGSSGIGLAIARVLGEEGYGVTLSARRPEKLEGAAEELRQAGVEVEAVPANMVEEDDLKTLLDRHRERFGRLDVLVNNAGIGTAVPATRETPEQFREVIAVNLNGCYWMAQACGRVMEPGSAIVNIGSVLGSTTAGLPQAAYAASKAAVEGLTRDLASQWTARKGIRVNALAPGFFPSEMTEQYPEGYLEAMMPRVLAGRKGDPEELAAALLFLASDASGYVTGAVLAVDGGMVAT